MSIKLKTFSVFLSVATAVTMIMPMAASAVTVADIQAQITALQAQLTALQGTPSTGGGYTFATDLKLGSTGVDVKNLQTVLNKDSATQIAQGTDAGAPGYETSYFGIRTKAAVIKFQDKYTAEVLTPVGLTSGTGYVGSMTRAKLNALYGGGVVTPGTPPVVPQGTGLTVTAGVQPTASLAPYNASRIPFTVVNFTASADGDVTVNSIVVERTGLAADATLSGIILLDENGLQLGLEKTLNSVHQVTLTEAFVVKAGTTKTLTIAGNRPTTAGSHGGEIAYLSLVAVNTSATVNGTLPITGTGQTINETLAVGSITNTRGPLDPGTTASKEVGTTGYTFSSIKITAGSNEKVRLLSIRWNQSGSAAKDDLANVKSYIDGVAYDTVVSSDGKYYTSTFGTGILIDKGFSTEISIKGDIVSGSARTIDFDIYKTTDLYLKGETYGYGIIPATSGTGFSTSNPWYNASAVTVSAGTLAVSKNSTFAAQNIAVNLADQPIGAFDVEAKGEPVSVAQMIFYVASSSCSVSTGTGYLTSVSMFDENGKVVAGPVDGTAWTATRQTLTFADTVTFPVGKHTYTLKGKVASGADCVYTVSTTPSADASTASNWTTVKGQSTGVTIYPTPYTAVAANAVTLKSGALDLSVSTFPLAQTVIAGVTQFTFANYVLNAGNSGEDVSINSMKLSIQATSTANAQFLTNCKLYDGTTALTTGSNAVTPTGVSSSTSFVFDSPLTIPKAASKTISLKCDIAGSAYPGIKWIAGYGYAAAADGTVSEYMSPTGKVSGQAITETYPSAMNGQFMTAAEKGTYTVVDDSTPGYSIVASGTTGATLLRLKFIATSEDIDIYKVDLYLPGVAATSSRDDLVGQKLYLYDSANPTVLLATAQFNQSATRYASSTLIAAGAFRVPAGSNKTMLVKGDIAAINYTQGPITHSGDLLQVGYLANNGGTSGNYGKGASSGTTINDSTATAVTSSGVRILKAYPTLAKDTTSTAYLATGAGFKAYRFHATANGGDVYLSKFTFEVSSSTGGVIAGCRTGRYQVYAYTDSGYSLVDSTFNTTSPGLLNDSYFINGNGLNSPTTTEGCSGYVCRFGITNLTQGSGNNGIVEVYPYTSSATTTYKVPSGTIRYFELRMNVNGCESTTGTESLTVQLNGDATYPDQTYTMSQALGTGASALDADANDNFIWSPNSTSSTVGLYDLDYTNGYGLPGLPTTNMDSVTWTSSN